MYYATATHAITVRSRAGVAREVASFPFTDAELETHLLRLENAILRPTGERRTVLSPREASVQNFGRQLFDFLLVGEARALYYECQQEAANLGQGLRIKLHVQSPRLAALPWEFLYDPRKRDYFCLDPHTPLVRYPELAQSATPLAVTPPLRILGMVASPKDLPLLAVDEEKRRVEQALDPLQRRGLVELTWLLSAAWRDLQQVMRPGYGPWHIFHFEADFQALCMNATVGDWKPIACPKARRNGQRGCSKSAAMGNNCCNGSLRRMRRRRCAR